MTTDIGAVEESASPLKAHPIELMNVAVRQLTFIANASLSSDQGIEGSLVQLSVRQDPIDMEVPDFIVVVRAAYGIPGIDSESEKPPSTFFSLLVELEGAFHRHIELPESTLKAFQNQGALLCLTPYLREQVYNLSSRGGIRPVIIPLLQVPSISVRQTQE